MFCSLYNDTIQWHEWESLAKEGSISGLWQMIQCYTIYCDKTKESITWKISTQLNFQSAIRSSNFSHLFLRNSNFNSSIHGQGGVFTLGKRAEFCNVNKKIFQPRLKTFLSKIPIKIVYQKVAWHGLKILDDVTKHTFRWNKEDKTKNLLLSMFIYKLKTEF